MTWASIGGAAVGVVGGSLLGGNSTPSDQFEQSNSANPFTAGGGLFSTSWQQQPGTADYQKWVKGGNGSLKNSDGTDGYWKTIQGSNGPMGLNMEITDPMLQAINEQGLFGASQFLDMANNNATADMAGQMGQDFLQQLGAYGNDPYSIANYQYGLLSPMLQGDQNQERMDLESRLYSQGRLGSTGGSQDFNALYDSQGDTNRKLLYDSLGIGMESQSHLYNMAAGLSQLDPQLRGLFQNLGTQSLNIPLGIQQSMLEQARIAGGLAGGTASGSGSTGQLTPLQGIGAGLINQGVDQLGGAFDGMFSSVGTGSGDPYGFWGDGGFGGGR
jgi:hypothetical protein